ncbi:MAG: hypothetical protein NT062_28855, partial [Proteobacteria bacterium]|nr:hypothetical protein [Pseudomonadota bacterium]
MPHLAMFAVEAGKNAKAVAAAVEAAYLSIGATRGGDHRVRVGEVSSGWCVVTDSTMYTVDLRVAAQVADALGTRVVAVGARGSGSSGTAAAKTFGAWKTKVPSSGKPKAVLDAIERVVRRDPVPRAWEHLDRPGIELTFDLSKAHRTPGPFKDNTTATLAEVERAAQAGVSDSIMNERDPAKVRVMFGGLRTRWGWQSMFDRYFNDLFSSPDQLTPERASILLALAREALADLRSATKTWEAGGPADWRRWRWSTALAAALVARDDRARDELRARIDAPDRAEVADTLWSRFGAVVAEFAEAASYAKVVGELPDPGSAGRPGTPMKAAAATTSEGLTKFGKAMRTTERTLVTADMELDVCSLGYLGETLAIGTLESIELFTSGKRGRSIELASSGVFCIAEGPNGALLTHEDKKVVRIDLKKPKVHEL